MHGLKGRPELNGEHGTALLWIADAFTCTVGARVLRTGTQIGPFAPVESHTRAQVSK